ncbi:MAG TPA: hypothetical protein VEA79_14185 [Phenylobacterium sp.]|nr:hypothetical protein [Phenylobacterium sp.]
MSEPVITGGPILGGPIEGERFQRIAFITHQAVLAMLNEVLRREVGPHGGDGGPVLTGAVAAWIEFALQNPTVTAAEHRDNFLRVFDEMAPRIEAARLADAEPVGGRQ